jgi:glycosyltransferase involved in cell wall biosynthesis
VNVARFSIVIPAHDEEFELPRTLAAFTRALENYRATGGTAEFEFIVVDNDSMDATARIARAWGARVITESKRQIARVRNSGARAAIGEILVTCDADSQPYPHVFAEIERRMNGNTFAGGVRIWAEQLRWSWYLPFFLVNAASVVLRLPCGMYFLRREDFLRMGGFDESLYALEDVEFARRLRAEARRRRMKIATLMAFPIMTSTRKLRLRGVSVLAGRGLLAAIRPRKYLTSREFWVSTYYGPGLRDSQDSTA